VRRTGIAAAAALLTLAILPASSLAVVAGTLDQDVEPGQGDYLSDSPLTQTFTAGLTGQLTMVELYCVTDTGGIGSATLSVGSADATGDCSGDAAGWTSFVFASPPAVTAGQQYTIAFQCETPTHWGVAAAAYSGGAAGDGDGNPLRGVDDFAFRTYVLSQQTTPPTTTTGSSGSSGGLPWWLPAMAALVMSSLVVASRRQVERAR
jgi:hypothetical protein